MERVATPPGRVAGAAASWLLFAFSLTALLHVTSVVVGLGGYCASGGPYVNATECPDGVVLFAAVGVVGMLVAVGIGVVASQDFAAPLLVWAWPALFTSLGLVFLLAALGGLDVITNLVVAVSALAMGLAPLGVGLRRARSSAPLVGSRTITGDAMPEPLAAAHALIGLGIPVVAASFGVALAVIAVRSVG